MVSCPTGRVALALISAVVLHSESTRELPTIGYFVLFDWVYILAYLADLRCVAGSRGGAQVPHRRSGGAE
jgi:hypothetical protein